ncbi:hypothetical protein [Armatimonas sp.]|uniref:hypothetical protein n=1 Tax=Armatimonas sp. TaxID=1872638 RepID=UPI00286B60AC|nr:hypothetical protein [Armatimonas sp.]
MAVSWRYFCGTDIMPEIATPNSFNQNESHPNVFCYASSGMYLEHDDNGVTLERFDDWCYYWE